MSTKHHERSQDGPETVSEEAAPVSEVGDAGSSANPETSPALASAQEELATLRERVAVLEAQEARLTEESSSLKDQYMRKLADYENFRKRMFREREDALKFANQSILSDLITVFDDFDRGIASAEHAHDYSVLHDGVVLIRRQMAQMFANKYGLAAFEAAGQPFDPNIHEAVASEYADVEEPVVSQEFLPGYRLHDRVVRSAKVKVQMPSPAAKPQVQQDSGGGAGSAAETEAASRAAMEGEKSDAGAAGAGAAGKDQE
jgi:molecular chaperone GrpE